MTDTQKKYIEIQNNSTYDFATFAGGCFWCLETPYINLPGVIEVFAGYSGGDFANPTYEQVYYGKTGHRESVQVFFDPKTVSYKELVKIFWYQIDPTDPGGQFSDRGEPYTTAIFYNSADQQKVAEESKDMLEKNGTYSKPIATKILEYKNFYLAEEYHQKYTIKNSGRYKTYEYLSGRKPYKDDIKPKLDGILNAS